MKKTKIVCTISSLNCSVEFLRSLFYAGMNVVRINTAHGEPESIREIIRNTRAVSPRIGILIDTKGPEVRTTKCDMPIAYLTGEIVTIAGRPDMETTHDFINVSYVDIAKDVPVGKHLLFDDGALDIEVVQNDGKKLTGVVQNDGVLGSRKSVNIPGVHIKLPALTPRDVENIKLSIEEKVDFIAHSFVRNASDVKAVQAILDEYDSPIKIVSKIENQEGVDNIDEILEHSYGIMIARGDLGIEVPIEQIPGIQRQLIEKCIVRHRPVIVATQMLHSMITNPRPTRAEVADIANAIYARTDALMLSGETAAGKYPVEAVRTMASIAEQAETDLDRQHEPRRPLPVGCDQREFLAYTAIASTAHLGVKGIITDSETGSTARYLSAMRGSTFVLAICYKEQTQRFLTLSYGILPIHQRKFVSSEYIFLAALRMLRQKGHINLEDKIAYLSGSFGSQNATTFIEINEVGKVFAQDYRFHLPTHVSEKVEVAEAKK